MLAGELTGKHEKSSCVLWNRVRCEGSGGGARDGGGPLMTLVIQINISLELNSNNKNITVWNIGTQQLTYVDLNNLFIKPNSPPIHHQLLIKFMITRIKR